MGTVRDVYDRVCDVLLEPNGLITGVYTEAQFLLDVWVVVGDFVQRTGMVRSLINLPVTSGTASVGYPDYAMDVQEAFYDDRFLRRESGLSLDNLQRQWRTETTARPERWHEDRLPVKTVQLQPIPNRDGYTVTMTAPFYGTFSSTASPVTFDVVALVPFYGVISSFTGPIFLETPNRMLGTVADLVSSALNVTLLATMKPALDAFVLDDEIDFVPESFIPYIAFGVLAKVFSRDGETRDAARQKYTEARFSEGIMLGKALSDEATEEVEV
jgi:hypothetical protein